jgi:uracil-DNA glycosylase family 4
MQDQHDALEALRREVVGCRRCPRLVAHRERAASERRREYAGADYWAKAVPGFGDPRARLLVLGLAPAAHGANRTGRMFTGDLPNGASVWLMRAMHRAGFASQPHSLDARDGLRLTDAYITAAVRCAPPGNRPAPDETGACFPFLRRELAALPRVRLILALGAFAFAAAIHLAEAEGVPVPRPRPRFGHGHLQSWPSRSLFPPVLCTYHPSRQNTNTRVLTEAMLDEIFTRAYAWVNAEGLP